MFVSLSSKSKIPVLPSRDGRVINGFLNNRKFYAKMFVWKTYLNLTNLIL